MVNFAQKGCFSSDVHLCREHVASCCPCIYFATRDDKMESIFAEA